jgi:hypothetical protein
MTVNVEELLHDTLHEWADEGPRPPTGFAERVLRARGRRRARAIVATAVATAAVVVAAAVTVPTLGTGGDSHAASRVGGPADIVAHPEQGPPRDLIAAGDVALSAYHTYKRVRQPNGDDAGIYTWYLYNTTSGRYERTPWAWLDAAPGMRTAAVLERELPATRIGLVDMATGKVARWIEVARGVGSVNWSADGKRLVATTYSRDPDRLLKDHPVDVNGKDRPGAVWSRTGFYVVDVATGRAEWSPLPHEADGKVQPLVESGRADVTWAHEPSLLTEWGNVSVSRVFFDLHGRKVPAPRAERHVTYVEAGLSPDGRLVAGGYAGRDNSAVLDARTGERAALVPAQDLLAWADGNRLIAAGCEPKKCSGKARGQLLLVQVHGKKVVPLSGFTPPRDRDPGVWAPVFTRR